MKKMKYSAALILFFIGLFLVGEFVYVQMGTDVYDEYYTVSINKISGQENQKKLALLLDELCDENNCALYIQSWGYENNFTNHDIYYCSKNGEEAVREQLGLKGNHFKTLIRGDCTFEFKTLEDAYNENIFNGYTLDFSVIGERSDVSEITDGISNIVKVNTVMTNEYDNRYDLLFKIVWGVILVVLLGLTAYDILFQKKDTAIALTLGNPISKTVIKNIVMDICAYALIFFTEYFILSFITAIKQRFEFVLICFIILIIVNSLLYMLLYFIDLCGVLKGYKGGEGMLLFNYIMKFTVTIAGIIVISTCIGMLGTYKDYFVINEFMKGYKDFSYINTNMQQIYTDNSEELIKKREDFRKTSNLVYSQLYNEYNPIILNVDYSANIVVANKNAYSYLSDKIPDFTEDLKDDGIKILVPDEYMMKDYNYAKSLLESPYEENPEPVEFETIHYKSADIISFDDCEGKGFSISSNPIIIYDPSEPDEYNSPSVFICNISDNEFNEFLKANSLSDEDIIKTNVYENFNHYWTVTRTMVIILFITMIATIMFEITIIGSIISLEYKINAKDICIKKVLGYNILQRNVHIFVIIFTSVVLGGIITGFALQSLGMLNYMIVISVCIAGIILEILLVCIKIYKIEKTNVQKILKGGAL